MGTMQELLDFAQRLGYEEKSEEDGEPDLERIRNFLHEKEFEVRITEGTEYFVWPLAKD